VVVSLLRGVEVVNTVFRTLSAAALLLGLMASLSAEIVDNSTVTIFDSYLAFGGYEVEYAIDTGDDRYISDYASQGGGIDTYIAFDFGESKTFTEIRFTDRVTSGGPNFAFFGGLFDYVDLFQYTFSVDDNFTNGNGTTDDIVIEVEPERPEGRVAEEDIALLQTITTVPNVQARYLQWQILETTGNNPGANDFEFVVGSGGGLLGDFNASGALDVGDIDDLSVQVRAGTNPPAYDVTGDAKVDDNDRTHWVTVLAKTYFGDANLDGQFNSTDFVLAFQQGEYEDTAQGNSTWADGDWNGDAEFNSTDFVTAFQGGGFELGPRPAGAAVPEPNSLVLWLVGLTMLRYLRRV
jgi:hypothetical protein